MYLVHQGLALACSFVIARRSTRRSSQPLGLGFAISEDQHDGTPRTSGATTTVEVALIIAIIFRVDFPALISFHKCPLRLPIMTDLAPPCSFLSTKVLCCNFLTCRAPRGMIAQLSSCLSIQHSRLRRVGLDHIQSLSLLNGAFIFLTHRGSSSSRSDDLERK